MVDLGVVTTLTKFHERPMSLWLTRSATVLASHGLRYQGCTVIVWRDGPAEACGHWSDDLT